MQGAAPVWGDRRTTVEPGVEVIVGTIFQRCVFIPQAIDVGRVVLRVYWGNNVAAMGRSLVVITVHSPWWLSLSSSSDQSSVIGVHGSDSRLRARMNEGRRSTLV